jgi:hypothetical protein
LRSRAALESFANSSARRCAAGLALLGHALRRLGPHLLELGRVPPLGHVALAGALALDHLEPAARGLQLAEARRVLRLRASATRARSEERAERAGDEHAEQGGDDQERFHAPMPPDAADTPGLPSVAWWRSSASSPRTPAP